MHPDSLDCETLMHVIGEVWTPELVASRLDELIEERLEAAARDLTSLAVLEWNWPKRPSPEPNSHSPLPTLPLRGRGWDRKGDGRIA
jgi:hypothetical protein